MTDTRFSDVVVTISGPPCGGSSTIARLLAPALCRPLIEAGPKYRAVAKSIGLPQEHTWGLDPTRLKQIDAEMLSEVERNRSVVWEGRLTGWFARDMVRALRIWCSADIDIRTARYAEREKVDSETATHRIAEREERDRELFTRLYGPGCNCEDLALYQLKVSTDIDTPTIVVERILEAVRHFH